MPQTRDTTLPRSQQLRLRVPDEDGAIATLPDLSAGLELARRNAEHLAGGCELLGKPLARLRIEARRAVGHLAVDYTSHWRRPVAPPTGSLWFLSGHQPTLFHPGVWLKNFLIHQFARRCGGCSLNLVVDNDLCGSTSVALPVGSAEEPRLETIPFDVPRAPQPWEEMVWRDLGLAREFPEKVANALRTWNIVPLLVEYWPDVLQAREWSPRICDGFTAARNLRERRWGCENLELPLSRICETAPFHWFALHLLGDARRFQGIHNTVLAEYRAANHIRSHHHPVPELKGNETTCETPFWVWHTADRQRRRVFVAPEGGMLRLSDGTEEFACIPRDPDAGLAALARLANRGIRLRTRALSTTLFARLCLADLFVHGIGGAKYDELTDQLIERFYGMTAPRFFVASGTLLLPLPGRRLSQEAIPLLQRRLRDLTYHAERWLASGPGTGEQAALLREKESLIGAQQHARVTGQRSLEPAVGRNRFQRLRHINAQLAAALSTERTAVREELAHCERVRLASRILHSRDFAAVLHPAENLQSYWQQLARSFVDHG